MPIRAIAAVLSAQLAEKAAPKAIRSRKALVAFNADLERAAKEMSEEDA